MNTRDRIARSSVPHALATLGDGWTLQLLTALIGSAWRFSELEAGLGVPRSTLASRLRHLEAESLVLREPYQERPTRFVYKLSERGERLFAVLALADAYDVNFAGLESRLRHAPDEGPAHPLHAEAYCRGCGDAIRAQDVKAQYDPPPPDVPFLRPRPPRKRRQRSRSTRAPYTHARHMLEDPWAAKIIAAMLMGEKRFLDLSDATQAATNILSDRLSRLVAAEVLRHPSDPARAHEYQLSVRGLALYPMVLALIEYGDSIAHVTSLRMSHRCGTPVKLQLRCLGCPSDAGPPLLSDVSFVMQVPPCET